MHRNCPVIGLFGDRPEGPAGGHAATTVDALGGVHLGGGVAALDNGASRAEAHGRAGVVLGTIAFDYGNHGVPPGVVIGPKEPARVPKVTAPIAAIVFSSPYPPARFQEDPLTTFAARF